MPFARFCTAEPARSLLRDRAGVVWFYSFDVGSVGASFLWKIGFFQTIFRTIFITIKAAAAKIAK